VNVSDELTIGEFLIGILPRLGNDASFPSWPPDCFALCLALLKRTGAYAQLLRDWPPKSAQDGALETWTVQIRELGAKWRKKCQAAETFDDLADEWQTVCQSTGVPLDKARDRGALCEALMKLVAVADESFEGVGGPREQASGEDDSLPYLGSRLLTESGTLCVEVHGSRLRVFPRMHTPQNGLTERSLSHYLALCDVGEVTPQWLSSPFLQDDSMNLLLIPWPFEVSPINFTRQQIR